MKYSRAILGVGLLAFFLCIQPSFGATFNVSDSDELRSALSIAESNGAEDTINIGVGTFNTLLGYFEYVSSDNAPITIIGAGAGHTKLDALGSGRALHIRATGSSDAHINIRGITFQGGMSSEDGGGLLVEGSADIHIENCEFKNNVSSGEGGGLMIRPAQFSSLHATIRNNLFENNTSSYHVRGHGPAFRSGFAIMYSSYNFFLDCTVLKNEFGFEFSGSHNNTFINTRIESNNYGFIMYRTDNNYFLNTRFVNNDEEFRSRGDNTWIGTTKSDDDENIGMILNAFSGTIMLLAVILILYMSGRRKSPTE